MIESSNDKLNISSNALDNLSEEERAIAFSILQEYKSDGSSSLYDKLLYRDYDEMPVDIETFLHDERYLGRGLTDADGRYTLFPY